MSVGNGNVALDWRALALCICIALAGRCALAASPHEDAVIRLAASHDPGFALAIGRIVVKQAGLKAARAVLAEEGRAAGLDAAQWNARTPEWQDAERLLAQRVETVVRDRIEDPAWFRQAIAAVATRLLNAEEADELARHFTLPGGREQRIALEVDIIGELLLANYTFTNRIEPDVKGTERELAALQTLWWAHEPFRVRDFTPYPEAMRFVSQDPGIKYTKMLSIQGIEAMSAHVDRSAAEAVEAVRSARHEIAPFVSAYRARQASGR